MPLYDFECTKCEDVFEEFTAMSADPPVCSKCGAPTIRLISAVLFGKGKRKTPKANFKLSPQYQEKLKEHHRRNGRVKLV